MQIRVAQDSDRAALTELHHAAFGVEGPAVAELALALLDDPSAQPLIALVAIINDALIGSIMFSAAHIPEVPNTAAALLSPLAVAPAQQRQGIGKRLIEQGLDRLRQAGVELVFVLGNPRYYSRHGFSAQHAISAPYSLRYPGTWMALALKSISLDTVRGRLVCAQALNKPALW